MFFKIDVPKNFENFRGKKLRWSLFLITLQASGSATLFQRKASESATLLKGDSETDVFQ